MSNSIYVAINKIMAKCDGLTKDRQSQGGFKYRGIDDMYNYLHDMFVEEGVFSVPSVTGMQREERQSSQGKTLIYTLLNVDYTFYSTDGTSVSASVVGEAFDTGDKSASKALAIAHKYALFQITMLPTMLSDPDAEVHEVGPDVPRETSAPMPPPATPGQKKALADYSKLGAMTGEMEDWLNKRGDSLTAKQASQLINKIEAGIDTQEKK